MSYFTVNTNQDINDMLAYDLYRSFQSAVETIKQNGGSFKDIENICDSFMPIDDAHPDTIDTPIPKIQECRGDITISIKYNMIGVALTGHSDGEPKLEDFNLADAYYGIYTDALGKQYYFHEMKEKFAVRDALLENPVKESDPLMKFIEQEVPFRLTEIHGIENPDSYLVDDIIVELQNDTDILFDYDAIDNVIFEKIEAYNMDHDFSFIPLGSEIVLNKQWISDDFLDDYVAESNFILEERDARKLFDELDFYDRFDNFEDFLEVYEPETDGLKMYEKAKELDLVKEEYVSLSEYGIDLGLEKITVGGKEYPVVLNVNGEYIVKMDSESIQNKKTVSSLDDTIKNIEGKKGKSKENNEINKVSHSEFGR